MLDRRPTVLVLFLAGAFFLGAFQLVSPALAGPWYVAVPCEECNDWCETLCDPEDQQCMSECGSLCQGNCCTHNPPWECTDSECYMEDCYRNVEDCTAWFFCGTGCPAYCNTSSCASEECPHGGPPEV